MINNERGSILVIALSFVLAFSLLGVASIHHTFVQNEAAEKERASAEAFWIADGFAQRGLSKLKASWAPIDESGDLGDGRLYDLDFLQPDCAAYPNCIIESSSTVEGQVRTVRATIDFDPIDSELVFVGWDEI